MLLKVVYPYLDSFKIKVVYMEKIIEDIKNFKTFDDEVIISMNRLTFDERLQILITYNEMSIYYNELLFRIISS